ncbi:MAG: hypothetical protein HYX91_06020 [Chloroflexi bacterium]|nr:hypothetical protein [Chloroflexota bacterium]
MSNAKSSAAGRSFISSGLVRVARRYRWYPAPRIGGRRLEPAQLNKKTLHQIDYETHLVPS